MLEILHVHIVRLVLVKLLPSRSYERIGGPSWI